MNPKQSSLLFIVTLAAFFTACQYTFGEGDLDTNNISSMDELNIPSDFNYELTQEFEVVFPENHKSHLADVFQITNNDTSYLGRRLLDGSTAIFTIPQASNGIITVPISFTGSGDYMFSNVSNERSETNSKTVFVNGYSYMGEYNYAGKPNYLEPTRDLIDSELLGIINESLPESRPVPTYNPEYLMDMDMNTIVNDSAEVWITFVHEGAGYRNAVGYFAYDLANPPASVNEIDALTIIFPNTSFRGSGGQLISGDKVYLGVFPANTGIGWFLVPDGWNWYTQTVNENSSQVKYSFRDFNTFTSADYRQHMTFLLDEERELLLLGFEDISRPGGDNDFNDAIFYVTASPFDAIETAEIEVVKKPIDTDGDGVNDGYDDYPNDPERAYKSFYPGESSWGTLAYEDRWPNQGDYDFNDVVVDYQFEYASNSSNELVDIIIRTKLNAVGGEVKSGFFYEIDDLSAGQISSVTRTLIDAVDTTGYDITQGYINMELNGVEAGHSNAVIPIFQDAKEILPPPSGYAVTNVIEEAPYVDPVIVETRVYFTSPVSSSVVNGAPYNPFIVTMGIRGNEIHLPSYAPTVLADLNLFGTQDDATNLNLSSSRYKNSNGAPWAMHLPVSFDYPKENENILNVYSHFATWAESGGYSYMDWYVEKQGYRISSKIFNKQ